MSQAQFSGSKGFVSNGTLAAGILVKISSGKVVAASATSDKIVGVTEDSAVANETVSVRLLNAPGSVKAKAGGTIAVGALLTTDASGQVVAATQTTAGSQPVVNIVGRALEVAASGDIIEVMPLSFLY